MYSLVKTTKGSTPNLLQRDVALGLLGEEYSHQPVENVDARSLEILSICLSVKTALGSSNHLPSNTIPSDQEEF